MKKIGFLGSVLLSLVFLALVFLASQGFARTVTYELHVENKIVNFTGKNVRAIGLGLAGEEASIPAPLLEFNEGDKARIIVHNNLDTETSLHWHGILVPNDQDGVPHLTNPPIAAHSTYIYEFPINQSGTYWYHSHTDLQEQIGVYGPIVIHPKNEAKVDFDQLVVLSDWTNEKPSEVMRDLKTDPEYQQQCKGTERTWFQDIREHTVRARLKSEKERMGPMDVADVCYSGAQGAFLINGRRQSKFEKILPGQSVRLRLINASTSTTFHVAFGAEPLLVVAADGQDVQPVKVSEIKLAIAETYDVIVTMPVGKSVELRATSHDVTGSSSVIFGQGPLEKAPDVARPSPYMDSSHQVAGAADRGGNPANRGNPDDPHHCGPDGHWDEPMQMCMPNDCAANEHWDYKQNKCVPNDGPSTELRPLNYNMLKAKSQTVLNPAPTREIELRLDGNMRRYVWLINKKVFGESKTVTLTKGESVRIKIINNSMMSHPIHLHGHFFRLVNSQGDFSPLKHTVDIASMTTTTLEFNANVEGQWLLHCHIGPHMVSGMDLLFKTSVGKELPDAPSAKIMAHGHDMSGTDDMSGMSNMSDMSGKQWYFAGSVGATNRRAEGEFRAIEKDWEIFLRTEHEYSDNETRVRGEVTRNTTPNTGLYAGAEADHAEVGRDHANTKATGEVGARYRTPLMIETSVGVTTRGQFSISAEKEMALFKKTSVNLMFERKYGKVEWHTFVERRIKKRFLIKAGPSERGLEGGIQFRP